MTPTVRPPSRPSVVVTFGAHLGCSSSALPVVEQARRRSGARRRRAWGTRAGTPTRSRSSTVADLALVAEQGREPAGLAVARPPGVGDDVHDAGAAAVRLGAAEPQRVDVLAGDRAHDVGAGDEDPALRAEDDDVGERRAVRRAAGRRAEHHRDLRDLAGGAGHDREDLADGVQRDDALAQPGTAGVPEADDRARPRPARARTRRGSTLQPASPIAPPWMVASEQKATDVRALDAADARRACRSRPPAVISSTVPGSNSCRSRRQRVARVVGLVDDDLRGRGGGVTAARS